MQRGRLSVENTNGSLLEASLIKDTTDHFDSRALPRAAHPPSFVGRPYDCRKLVATLFCYLKTLASGRRSGWRRRPASSRSGPAPPPATRRLLHKRRGDAVPRRGQPFPHDLAGPATLDTDCFFFCVCLPIRPCASAGALLGVPRHRRIASGAPMVRWRRAGAPARWAARPLPVDPGERRRHRRRRALARRHPHPSARGASGRRDGTRPHGVARGAARGGSHADALTGTPLAGARPATDRRAVRAASRNGGRGGSRRELASGPS